MKPKHRKPVTPPGDTAALLNLAGRLGSADGIRRNKIASRRLYAVAARRRNPYGYYELGMSYLFDIPKRPNMGFKWMRRAARRGIVDAQEFLGEVYARGLMGRKKNIRAASVWFKQAIAKNSKKAKQALKELDMASKTSNRAK